MLEEGFMLFTFEQLSEILNLDVKNEQIDRLCFKTAYSLIEKYINYRIEDSNYNELHTVFENRILINQINIKEVVCIIDQNTGEQIEHCVIDYENKAIIFISCQYNGHVVFINFNSGFTAETLPAEIKQAIIELFMILKNNLIEKMNSTEKETEIPDIIKTYLKPYARKHL